MARPSSRTRCASPPWTTTPHPPTAFGTPTACPCACAGRAAAAPPTAMPLPAPAGSTPGQPCPTARLWTDDAAKLQWAMPVYGGNSQTAADRGNRAVACQDERPTWLSKPSFLAFGQLRSYALLQGRHLCAALRGRSLPFEQPAVQALVRQALYHGGELQLDAGGRPAQLWRTDWEGDNGVLATLCAELSSLADELRDSPRQCGQALLLGELAAFLSDWHTPLRDVARSFAAAAARWAEELEEAAQQAEPDDARSLRAQQCMYRWTALLCHAAGDLSADDAQQMLSMAVLAHYGSIYGLGTNLEEQLQRLQVLGHWALARRLDALLAAVKQDRSILTAALRTVLQRAPASLRWDQLRWTEEKVPSASFRAHGSDGHLYSINCLDGTVLEDGAPPGRLPREILEHRLYKRSFGSWGFEVTTTSAGVRRTIAPVAGRFYEFHLAGADGAELVAVEVVEAEESGAPQRRLQLLDPGPLDEGGCWGRELPVRLREGHSHWLDREGCAIVLRPRLFKQHDIAFLLQWELRWERPPAGSPSQAPAPAQFVVRRVPPDLKPRDDWQELLRQHGSQLTDQLVLHSSQITQVLSKFEQPAFIHCHIPAAVEGGGAGSSSSGGKAGAATPGDSSSDGEAADGSEPAESSASGEAARPPQMIFELPRFKLQFELRGGELRSLDHTSHRLASCQQLWQLPAAGRSLAEAAFTLPDFRQYLVLEPVDGADAASRRLVVVPAGRVVRQATAVVVAHAAKSGSSIQCHTYEVHPRFGHLCARSIPARLQLAGLCAATASLLPEPGSRLTGAQQAMRLLRQCWGVLPLGEEDVHLIRDAAVQGGHLAAGLRLLAHELLASAAQLNALHFPPPLSPPGHCLPPELDPEWAAAYQQERRRLGGLNVRMQLTPAEEVRAQGHRSQPIHVPLSKRLRQFREVEVPACPVAPDAVQNWEQELLQLVVAPAGSSEGGAVPVPEYPLPLSGGSPSSQQGSSQGQGERQPTPLERDMHEELEDSWRVHHSTAVPSAVHPDVPRRILQMQGAVEVQRQQAEAYLHAHLSAVPPSLGMHGSAFRLQRACGSAPEQGPLDLVRLALPSRQGDLPSGSRLALQLNPFLSAESAGRLEEGARIWLQLCVLEDRLQRLAALLPADDPASLAQLIQELLVHRQWSVAEHPAWLVFEAEQQLQIRPQQYWVARHLMANFGHIVQLNMGEGKTRVILPMLILHFASGQNLVRLNLLSPLLDEAYGHLHACLCASSLGRKLFVQPFHRDVAPTPELLRAMRSALSLCLKEGGVLLTTPERRLSLELKRQELWQQKRQELWKAMDALAALPYVDLLDESDALLTYIYQLIYAWGAPTELPALQARACAGQALLRLISQQGHQGDLGEVLAREGVAVSAGPTGKPGAFRGFRLLPGPALERALPELRLLLAEALLADPPYEMRWMAGHAQEALLLRCITNPAVDASAELAAAEPALSDDAAAHVLALRGLLACGVLFHCLCMRHWVEFGINDTSTGPARKRMAVPYRSAHNPSERSEYAQPDTALTLTDLAMYSRGLRKKELLEALHALLRLGQNAQRAHYDEWLRLAAADLSPDELEPFSSVSKLDTSNETQMRDMHARFSHNTAAVDFFLNVCVFPRETRQFPSRLVATAWNLADTPGGRVVGFSGTNDNHRLLPLQVRQHLEVEASLRGTNGKMLGVLLGNPRYDTLRLRRGEEVWEALLLFAAAERVDAVVDCGALLAGVSNRKAADFLLGRMDRSRFRGVCFFDEKQRQWVIVDLHGRSLARHCSPIRESQALTLFDEARCRGADLQLRPDAVGLLTLGPTTCKDKLMQSAGRLRRLGKGQTLRTVGTADVTSKIARVAGLAPEGAPSPSASALSAGSPAAAGSGSPAAPPELTSRHVLAWAMANTVAATQKGVLEWAGQGLLFAVTSGAPKHALQPEVLDLPAMYGGARSLCGVPALVAQQSSKRQVQRSGASAIKPALRQLMAEVVAGSQKYGEGHEVVAQGGLGEECERELEREEEQEEEVEQQVARIAPTAETDWQYSRALGAASLELLQQHANLQLLPLPALVRRLHPASLQQLPWSGRVFATPNFARPTQHGDEEAVNDYLRPAGQLLLLAGSAASDSSKDSHPQVVLLSEREASGILEALWSAASPAGGAGGSKQASQQAPLLVSLAYASAAQPVQEGAAAPPLRLAVAARLDHAWQAESSLARQLRAGAFRPHLVSIRLFDGDTTFVDSPEPWASLRVLPDMALLRHLVAGRLAAVEALVGMRGKAVLLSRSQLEMACDAEQAAPDP